MPAALGIGAAGSIIGGIIQGSAAKTAAGQQAAQDQKALALEQANQQQATTYQNQQLAATQQQQQPFLQAGQGALSSLSNLLGVGSGTGQAGYGSLLQGYGSFQAPTAAQAEAQPGYQFQLQQGENALQNSAAARGSLLSGATAAGLQQYGQQAAQTDYQQVYNNQLSAYQNNFNTFQANQANEYNRLSGLTSTGQNAANTLASAQQAAAQNTGNILTQQSQIQGSTLGNIGNAQAAGTIGQANAYSGALGSVSNLASQGAVLNYLQNAQQNQLNAQYGSSYGQPAATPGLSQNTFNSILGVPGVSS
jgi:hypothetical protein